MGKKKVTSEDFWLKVDKTGDCWEWRGGKDKDGYGTINFEGKTRKAHRMSWYFTFGAMPNLNVLHRCDNPGCVNPNHLFLVTQKENMADCKNKGRTGNHAGEKNARAILNNASVLEIRSLADKMSKTEISKLYDVSFSTISNVIERKTWGHI